MEIVTIPSLLALETILSLKGPENIWGKIVRISMCIDLIISHGR
jgi:hypothetical protein